MLNTISSIQSQFSSSSGSPLFLQEMIGVEKSIAHNVHRLRSDFTRSAELMKIWSNSATEDLKGVLTDSSDLVLKFVEVLSRFASCQAAIPGHIEDFRKREGRLDELKRKQKAMEVKVEAAGKKLEKMLHRSKNYSTHFATHEQLKEQLTNANTELATQEAQDMISKRNDVKSWIGHRFGSLQELSESSAIIARCGKQLLQENYPQQLESNVPQTSYTLNPIPEGIMTGASQSLQSIQLPTSPSTSPISSPNSLLSFNSQPQAVHFSNPSLPAASSPLFPSQPTVRPQLAQVPTTSWNSDYRQSSLPAEAGYHRLPEPMESMNVDLNPSVCAMTPLILTSEPAYDSETSHAEVGRSHSLPPQRHIPGISSSTSTGQPSVYAPHVASYAHQPSVPSNNYGYYGTWEPGMSTKRQHSPPTVSYRPRYPNNSDSRQNRPLSTVKPAISEVAQAGDPLKLKEKETSLPSYYDAKRQPEVKF